MGITLQPRMQTSRKGPLAKTAAHKRTLYVCPLGSLRFRVAAGHRALSRGYNLLEPGEVASEYSNMQQC